MKKNLFTIVSFLATTTEIFAMNVDQNESANHFLTKSFKMHNHVIFLHYKIFNPLSLCPVFFKKYTKRLREEIETLHTERLYSILYRMKQFKTSF